VLGVDIDDRMAEVARRYDIDVETAKFEDWVAAVLASLTAASAAAEIQ
jgi:hypothetical protein